MKALVIGARRARQGIGLFVARALVDCLCDKPLWWDDRSENRTSTTSRLVGLFEQHGKYVALLTQWPHALPAFYRLFPDVESQTVESFAMHLGPISSGPRMVLDSMSHPLSVLERLVGPAEVTDVRSRKETSPMHFS